MARKRERTIRKAQPEPAAPLPREPIDWQRHLFVMLGVWTLALAAYSNSFGGKLLFDSGFIVQDDPRIRMATVQNVSRIWSTGYWFNYQDTSLYRPLTTLSYMVNYAVLGNGTHPAGYHWINFLLHLVGAALVYGLGLLVFRHTMRAAALAALWAVHPLLTESVTNVVGRADILAGIGVLAGLLCHAQAIAAARNRERAGWLVGLAAASAVAIFSKESGIVLIALILAYDLAFRKGGVRLRLSSYAAAALPVLLFLYQRWQVIAPLPIQPTTVAYNPLLGAGFWSGRLTAIHVIGRYMVLILWPRHLSYNYCYNQVPLFRGTFDNWGDWETVLGVLACLATGAAAVVAYRRNPPIFFLLAMFFIALVPVANLVLLVGAIMAERFLYLPAVGALGCVVWAVCEVLDRCRAKWPATPQPVWILGVICLALVLRTHARNADWETAEALFANAAEAAPDSYRTHLDLAVNWKDHGNLDAAVREAEQSLRILDTMPGGEGDVLAYANIGPILRMKGDQARKGGGADAEAIGRRWYQKSLDVLLRGDDADRKRAAMLTRLNEGNGRARMIFGTSGLYQDLALTWLRLGEPGKAISALEYGMAIRPDREFFPMLSAAYSTLADREDAAIALMEGLVIQPGDQRLASALVSFYRAEPSGCALASDGASVNLACDQVHGHLCAGASRAREFFERRGQYPEAAKVRQAAASNFGCAAQ